MVVDSISRLGNPVRGIRRSEKPFARIVPWLACLLLSMVSLQALAQEARRRFDPVPGVPTSEVSALVEDDSGFIWLGGDDGVARFDGRRLEPVAPRDALGAANDLALQDGRYLWIAADRGLWRQDLRAERLVEVPCTADTTRFEQLEIAAGHVWALSHAGLRRIAESGLDCEAVTIAGLPEGEPVERFHVDDATVWLAVRRHGIWRCPRPCATAQPWALPDTRVRWISSDGDGGLYAGTHRHGLYRLDRNGEIRDHWWRGDDAPANRAFTTNGTMSLVEGADGKLYAGLWGGGLMEIGADGAIVARSLPMLHEPTSLGGANVQALLLARDGTLWIGHEQGLSLLDPVRNQLPWIGPAAEGQAGLGPGGVRAMLERDGRLLVGSLGGGVASVDLRSGALTQLSVDAVRADSLPSDDIWAATAADGWWMLATFGGLARVSTDTLAVQRLVSTPQLPSDDVVDVEPAADGGFWLGVWAGGVVKVDALGRVQQIWGAGDGLRLATMTIVYEDRSGRVLASNSEGLFQLQDDGRFHAVEVASPSGAARPAEINAVLEDADGTLWMGSASGGIVRWRAGDEGPAWFRDDVLSSITIHTLLPRAGGGLWLGTQLGLLGLDAGGELAERIDKDAGLEFEIVLSLASASDGAIWVGGSNGVHRVDPHGLRYRALNGYPVVTGVRLFNKPLKPDPDGPLSASPSRGGVLDLDFTQDMLTLDFALPGLPQPHGVKFRYRLQNFDRDWVEVSGDDPRAVYTRLAPGDYHFEVEAGSAAGWSGHLASLPITVRPPWWMTWWARLLFVLAAVVIVFLWHRLRTLQLRAQAQRLESTVTARTTELRDANEALRQAARTDALTRLSNRRGFREDIEARWPQLSGQASLLLADIDHFKAINDRCGHEAGDAVLVAVAERLRSQATADDLLARWGGEEFLCLLTGGDVVARAEAMRRAVSGIALPEGCDSSGRVTITAGLTPIGSGDDFADAVRRADALLYDGKRAGRDRLEQG